MNEDIQDRFKVLAEMTSTFSNQLLEAAKILEQEAPGGFLELSKYGWYLGFDSLPKTPVELGRKLHSGKSVEVDEILKNYYEEELENIEWRLINRNPKRNEILKEALKNHREQNYCSAITVFLTQADGICYDRAKKLFFKNNGELRKKKVYRPEIEEELKNIFAKEFAVPLMQPTAINEHSDHTAKFPVKLNRHEILHGMDTSFGTKINSLKIISFLNYINDIVEGSKNLD